MMRLITTICLALLSLSVLAHAEKDAKQAVPSFKPGAKVEVVLSINCPKGWAHNPNVPLKLKFDEEYLKTAPFSVGQPVFSTKIEGHPHSAEIKVPITLSGKLPDGELKIPAQVDAFICLDDESMCVVASEAVSMRIRVQDKAAKGEKNQAQGKGSLTLSHLLEMPE